LFAAPSAWAVALLVLGSGLPLVRAADDSLSRVRRAEVLRYGCDAEGGGPYAYPDPESPGRTTGFEVELMRRLCGALGPKPVLYQGQWDALLPTLASGHVDVVVNGYELTPERTVRYLASRPYYVFQLQLMVPRGGPIGSFEDLTRPRPNGRRWVVSVLGGSAAETYIRDLGLNSIELVRFNGATDCMMAVTNGQSDATLQDLPAARFYRPQYPALTLVEPPVGKGYYVMYLRREDRALRDAMDAELGRMIGNGELRTLYDKYGIWTDAQEELPRLGAEASRGGATQESGHGIALLGRYSRTLVLSAAWTVFLACTSMPLAMALGLSIALGRLYGPQALRWGLTGFVELTRGTPLMLQLFVLFFLLPRLGLHLDAVVAGVAGLALNYSAYESEIYRAGLQAIPVGQMEAALALGMSRGQALRRIIVPQAVRIVIPPVTNDFIALFKDTSVCSVISITELTKQYAILANSTGGVIEFAAATAVLYLVMSVPLSWLARWCEQRLAAEGGKGVRA
jgi:polar amino acid transport system substrate-binding protein